MNGYLYQHEDGYDDDGEPMTNVYIESSDFEIGNGDSFAFINKIIPDFKFIENQNDCSVNVVLKTRNYPGQSLVTRATEAIQETTAYKNIRARGRQAALRIESDDDATNSGNLGVGWRLGATRLNIKQDGRR